MFCNKYSITLYILFFFMSIKRSNPKHFPHTHYNLSKQYERSSRNLTFGSGGIISWYWLVKFPISGSIASSCTSFHLCWYLSTPCRDSRAMVDWWTGELVGTVCVGLTAPRWLFTFVGRRCRCLLSLPLSNSSPAAPWLSLLAIVRQSGR